MNDCCHGVAGFDDDDDQHCLCGWSNTASLSSERPLAWADQLKVPCGCRFVWAKETVSGFPLIWKTWDLC